MTNRIFISDINQFICLIDRCMRIEKRAVRIIYITNETPCLAIIIAYLNLQFFSVLEPKTFTYNSHIILFKRFYSRLILFKLCRFFSSPPWVLALDQTGGDIHLSMYCFTVSISNRCSIYLLSLLLT